MKAVLVGYGYWGPVLAKNLNQSTHFSLFFIVEPNPQARQKAEIDYPYVKVLESLDCLPASLDNWVFFVATPPSTHFEIATRLLARGAHVWLEKPATTNLKTSIDLVRIGLQHERKIVVDHPYLYAPAIEYIRERSNSSHLGKMLYIESVRANLGIFSPDVNVLWDLVVHDIAITLSLTSRDRLDSVSCIKVNPVNNITDSMVHMNMFFESGCHAHFSANWLSPIKVRRMVFGFQNESIIYDDVESSEKLKIYSQQFSSGTPKITSKSELLVNYRTGDILVPRISSSEPIMSAMQDFGNTIQTNKDCKIELRNQLPVIQVLELAEVSAENGGAKVKYYEA